VTIVAAVVAGELLLGQTRAGGDAFTISIDHGAWEKWGFQYPATYVFDLPDVPATVEAQRRDGGSDTWTSLPNFVHDVAELNEAFDKTCQAGGIFYALWHPDRFRNSLLYDPRPGIEGVQGSTLMQHLTHVAHQKDVWYYLHLSFAALIAHFGAAGC
jgi:hypothetical protein